MTHSMDLDVVGWGPAHASAHAVLVHYSRWGRILRAVEGFLVVWAIALPMLLVPTLIIPVVANALALSIFLFVVRLRASEVAKVVRGTCPDCGHTQFFDVPTRFRVPLEVECQQCSRGLKLEEAIGEQAPVSVA